MTDQAVPKILLTRAQIILQRKIDNAYRTNIPNVIKCHIGKEIVYVDLVTKAEVDYVEDNTAKGLPSHADLSMNKPSPDDMISRAKVLPTIETKKTVTKPKSVTVKATSTKKKK